MIPTLVSAQTETPRQRVAVLELGNPAGLDRQEITNLTEIVRGGSWYDEARGCRSANRGGGDPFGSGSVFGFRVVAGSAGQ
jgi:formylglycine-generating enzyme required for sulfatase activity